MRIAINSVYFSKLIRLARISIATADLMGKFYQQMLEEDLSPTAALREAQLEMWKGGSPPYEWAAFVVQGEWRD